VSAGPHPPPLPSTGSGLAPGSAGEGGSVFSGSLLLAGAYALLVPGGRGVALPWPPLVRVSARPSTRWSLAVRDDRGPRRVPVGGVSRVAADAGPLAVRLDFGDAPAGGTSALACLAVAAARGLEGPGALAWAQEQHRALQGGRGSGYDVAVSALRRPVSLLADAAGGARATPLVPRGDPFPVLVAVGEKRGRTGDWIARFERARVERPVDVARWVRETSAAADVAREAVEVGSAQKLAEALERLTATRPLANELLGDAYGAPLDVALASAAHRLAVAAHPSGAAGDVWLAAHPDPGRLDALAEAWRVLGLRLFRAACGAPILGLSGPGRGA